MCLVTKYKYRFKWPFRITAYKIVSYNPKDNSIKSPFVRNNLNWGLNEAEGPEQIEGGEFPLNELRIKCGFIHCYRKLEYAEQIKAAYFISNNPEDLFRIIKVYVPPFTPFYIGKYNEICAKQIYIKNFVGKLETISNIDEDGECS